MLSKGMSRIDRRRFLKTTGGLAGAGLVAGCTGSQPGSDGESEEDFPSDTVRMIVPYGTGGGYDFYGRLISKYLEEEYLSVGVQVENVSGAAGIIGMNQLYEADPDGYTAGIVNMQEFMFQQALAETVEDMRENLEFDLTEFTYYPQVAASYLGIAVGTNTDIETWEDYVEAVRNEEVRFSAVGAASTQTFVPALIGELSGLYDPEKVFDNVVTHEGKAATVKSIMAGNSEAIAAGPSSIAPFIQSGDLRQILHARYVDEPPAVVEGTATLKTASPEIERAEDIANLAALPRVFAGPPGVPEERANALRDAISEAVEDEGLKAEASEADRPLIYRDSAAVRESVDASRELFFSDEITGLLGQLFG